MEWEGCNIYYAIINKYLALDTSTGILYYETYTNAIMINGGTSGGWAVPSSVKIGSFGLKFPNNIKR